MTWNGQRGRSGGFWMKLLDCWSELVDQHEWGSGWVGSEKIETYMLKCTGRVDLVGIRRVWPSNYYRWFLQCHIRLYKYITHTNSMLRIELCVADGDYWLHDVILTYKPTIIYGSTTWVWYCNRKNSEISMNLPVWIDSENHRESDREKRDSPHIQPQIWRLRQPR